MIRPCVGRQTRRARAAAAVVFAAALVAGSGAPAFAQRRQAEPEANPDFQNQIQGNGSPSPAASAPADAPSSGAAAPASSDEKLVESGGSPGVQIGAVPTAKPAAPPAAGPLDTRVSVRVTGAPLATFLNAIAAQAKLNFIITEGLESRRVTAFLQNVTVREALQILLEIKGLTYQQIGKSRTYVVMPRSKQAENRITRIYNLSYIPLIPLSGDSETETQKGAAMGQASGLSSQQMSLAQGGGGSAKLCARKYQNISIVNVVCTVLSRTGEIELEPRTNSLIVTDIPESFPQVEQILAELDKKAPQVMIEAQIVEIDSDRARDLGFEWGGANGELGTFTGGERDTSFPLNLPKNLGSVHFFDPLNPAGGIISSLSNASGANSTSTNGTLSSSQGGFLKTSVLDLSQLRITLRALVQRTEARFLGKPKVLTLNNKTAKIEIASDEAVAIQSNITGGQGTSQATTSAERFETGVILKVTPQVNKEGYITMLVEPSFTDTQQAAISTAANPVFNPVKRTAVTLVRVKNGQTLVLGGLLRSTESKSVRKVPFLGYIPIIGWLFTSESSSRRNTDLVIFITPTIVSD